MRIRDSHGGDQAFPDGRWYGEGESYIKGKWMEDPAGGRELSESVGAGAYLGGTGRSYCIVQRLSLIHI